jgi:hypothetical protein
MLRIAVAFELGDAGPFFPLAGFLRFGAMFNSRQQV